MSAPLKTYRLCRYNGSIHDLAADWIEAAGDEEAIAHAQAVGFTTKCEIWDGNRLIAELSRERRAG